MQHGVSMSTATWKRTIHGRANDLVRPNGLVINELSAVVAIDAIYIMP